jgi:tetratricopeptide (TPR) repeat protein
VPEPSSSSDFVGRWAELQELLLALADATAGRGRLMLLAGEPGIGKTRLADELAQRARAQGAHALWGSSWQDAGAPPYWPWVQILRSCLRSIDDATAVRLLGDGAADVAQVLPEVQRLVPGLAPPPALDPESARFRLFDATATFLVRASRDQILVLVLDDLHAADAASLLFLQFLAGQLTDARILVVATYRDMEFGPDHPFWSAVTDLAREPGAHLLTLHGLGADAVGRFVARALGAPARGQLVTSLWRMTRGNPLFVGQAVRLLAGTASGTLDPAALRLAVPAGIREAIARRLAQLSDRTLTILDTAAALGPEFSLDPLRWVGGETAEELIDRLDPAVQAGLILESGSPGVWRFAHDLVRQTLYDELPSSARIQLHHRIGRELEVHYASDVEPHLAELAYHFHQALEVGGADNAAAYAKQAAKQAAGALAYEEAARFYRMALTAHQHLGPGRELERIELLLDLGDALARAGDLSDARESFLTAAAAARARGAGTMLGRAALGYGGRFVWARAGDDPHLIPMLQDALEGVGEGDERLTVRLLARLACAWRSAPERFADSDAASLRAVAIARRLADPASLSYALVGRCWAINWPDNPADRLAIARELLMVAEDANDPERTLDGHQALFVAYSDLGQMAAAKGEVDILRRAARALRQPPHVTAMRTYETVVALLEGAFETAEQLINAEATPPMVTPIRDNVSTEVVHRFLLRREQGRLAEEEATIRAAVDDFPWYPYFRSALTCLLLELGRTTEAREAFELLARDDFAALYRDCEWLLGMALASEACARLSDGTAAASLYRQLLPYAGRHAVAHAEGSLGAVDRYLGLLAGALGRVDEAVRHLEAGVALSEQLGARPWTAHAQADLAAALVARDGPGDATRAATLVHAAREAAEELGMVALQARLGADAGPVPHEADLAVGATVSGRHGVIRREGEYWTVAYEGDSFRLRDAKGIRYLARLLAEPDHELHVLDLVQAEVANQASVPVHATASVTRSAIQGADLAYAAPDVGEILDAAARQAYRERLRELEQELAEAQDWNDPERAARLKAERSALVEQLAQAVGLGGRSRVAASASERARLSVTKALRSATQRIAAQSPALGQHLDISLHTGTFCVYRPDPALAITWDR